MWFDTHCHLYDIAEPRDAAARARAAGVEGIVVVGVDPSTSRAALDLTGDGIWAGAAWHPTSVKGWKDEWADEIDDLLSDPRVRAVGETGINLYWDKTYLDDQVRALRAHIALSKKHDKALVLHTRDSVDETIEVLKSEGPPARLIFHCWSGALPQLRAALELGAFISFAGNTTFKNADELREAARAVPADRILIETDSPYLSPVPHRGRPNEPAFVVHTGEALALARDVPTQDFARCTSANAAAVFGI
ncbi:MAG: TatD family hydrolase [Actinomycetota bacterium]